MTEYSTCRSRSHKNKFSRWKICFKIHKTKKSYLATICILIWDSTQVRLEAALINHIFKKNYLDQKAFLINFLAKSTNLKNKRTNFHLLITDKILRHFMDRRDKLIIARTRIESTTPKVCATNATTTTGDPSWQHSVPIQVRRYMLWAFAISAIKVSNISKQTTRKFSKRNKTLSTSISIKHYKKVKS